MWCPLRFVHFGLFDATIKYMMGTMYFTISLLFYVAAAALVGEGTVAVQDGGVAQDGGAAQDGGCGSMGQLRCDQDGLHVEVCTRSGAWSHVDHCGVQGAVCVDGRCVGNTRVAQAEDACNVNEKGCSSDCTQITQCSQSNNWVVVGVCSTGTLCRQGECVRDTVYTCGSKGSVTCGTGSVGHFFPNMDDCSSYYACTQEWAFANIQLCKEGYYFDPCSSSKDPCTLLTDSSCRNEKYTSCGTATAALDMYVWSNPSKYYTCVYGTDVKTVWKKCDVGYYDEKEAMCLGKEYVCGNNANIDNSNSNSGSGSNSDTGSDPDPLKCTSGERWAVKDDECRFYHCYSAGNVIIMTCDKNSKYSVDKKGCIYASGYC